MVIDIPVIRTPRLILRGHRPEDFDAYLALVSDRETPRYFSGPLSREDAWARFLRGFGYWAVLGYGSWAVEEMDTGRYAGIVSIFDAKRDIDPPLDGAEAGWSLAQAARGKGYATEAMTAALSWFDAHFASAKVNAIVAVENKPSIRVAEKTGFAFAYETMFKDHPSLVYVRAPAAS
jgi:RimJ/RimL family protein N-acetyltransferase